MKKTLIAAFLMAILTSSIYAQGTVLFITRTLGIHVTDTAQFFAANPNGSGSSNVVGGLFYAQLFAADGSGVPEGSLNAVGNLVNFRTGANAGYVQDTAVQVYSNKPNGVITAVLCLSSLSIGI